MSSPRPAEVKPNTKLRLTSTPPEAAVTRDPFGRPETRTIPTVVPRDPFGRPEQSAAPAAPLPVSSGKDVVRHVDGCCCVSCVESLDSGGEYPLPVREGCHCDNCKLGIARAKEQRDNYSKW